MRKFPRSQTTIPFLQRQMISARAKLQQTQADIPVFQRKIASAGARLQQLQQSQADVPFLKRQYAGVKGQSMLQAGIASSCFLVFVGLPMVANEMRAETKDLEAEFYAAKGQFHKDRFEHELMMRKRAIAGTLHEPLGQE